MFSETDVRGTVCGKPARTGLWGSGEVTNRSTRKISTFHFRLYGCGITFSLSPVCSMMDLRKSSG